MIKFTTQLFCLATLALGTACAESPYDVTLYDNVSVNGTQLKAGDYQVEMQGDKAVFKSGSKTVQIVAKLLKSDQTYPSTVFVSQHSKLVEIDFGGTQNKMVFGADAK